MFFVTKVPSRRSISGTLSGKSGCGGAWAPVWVRCFEDSDCHYALGEIVLGIPPKPTFEDVKPTFPKVDEHGQPKTENNAVQKYKFCYTLVPMYGSKVPEGSAQLLDFMAAWIIRIGQKLPPSYSSNDGFKLWNAALKAATAREGAAAVVEEEAQ